MTQPAQGIYFAPLPSYATVESRYSCIGLLREGTTQCSSNGFFVYDGIRTSCGTSVVMIAKPRYTSKPERGRWANPRAGWLKIVWDAVEEWLHTAEKRVRFVTVWACYAQNLTTGSAKRVKWEAPRRMGVEAQARRLHSANAGQNKSVNACSLTSASSRVGKADAVPESGLLVT